MKKLIFGLAIVLILFSCRQSNKEKDLKPRDNLSWIRFEWAGDSISGRYYEKLAILIPFKIGGIPHDFKSQFDLGAVATCINGNSFKPYMSLYPEINEKLDTLNKHYMLQGKNYAAFKGIDFWLGTVPFSNRELVYFEGQGDTFTVDSVKSKTIKHIGTIGADLFQNKTLIIDYPNQRIAIVDSLPRDYYENTEFVACKLEKGRIKVPFKINNEVHYLMFDTGSSIFSLLTTKINWMMLCNTNTKVDTLRVNAWGEHYDVYGAPITADVCIGSYKMPSNFGYATPRSDFGQWCQEEGILGLTGNAYFWNDMIAIDFKDKRFGIIRIGKKK